MKLETDYGTFEAETEKELMAAARKAKRKHDKLLSDREGWSKIARLRACAMGYEVLQRKAAGEAFPPGWRVYEPGDGAGYGVRVQQGDAYTLPVLYVSDYGKGVIEHYRQSVAWWLENGCGYPMLVALNDEVYGPKLFAVGIEQDRVAFVEVCGVGKDEFRRAGQIADEVEGGAA